MKFIWIYHLQNFICQFQTADVKG